MKWEMPPHSGSSCREPVRSQIPTETDRTWGMDSVSRTSPFGSISFRMFRGILAAMDFVPKWHNVANSPKAFWRPFGGVNPAVELLPPVFIFNPNAGFCNSKAVKPAFFEVQTGGSAE